MSENFSLLGFDRVRAKLRLVKDEIRGKATRSALRRASGILVRAAKENVMELDDPETGRRIADNIQLQFGSKVYAQTGKHLYRIGVGTRWQGIAKGNPDTGPRGNTPHWHLLEYGTRRSREKSFMRKALRSNVNPVINRFENELNRELDKALK